MSTKTIYTWLGKQTTSNPSALEYNRLKRERDELLKLVGKLTMDLSKEKRVMRKPTFTGRQIKKHANGVNVVGGSRPR